MGMASFNVSTTLVVFTLLCMSREAAGIEYIYHSCSNSTNLTFTPNSTYQSNLYQLFSSLSSNSTRQDGFYNNTVGRNASDSVYGLFLCRGDLTVKDCQDCVASATQDLTQKYCPVAQEAIIYYEECMLRYSYRYFFSNMITAPSINEPNRHNISDPVRFNQLLTETMSGLITQVANDGTSDKKFATKAASFTGSQILYTLEQCTPDISSSDCSTCIQTAIALQSKCCGGLQGVRVMLPSCRIRYEMYQFYRTLNIAPTPTPIPAILPPSPSPVSQNSGQ